MAPILVDKNGVSIYVKSKEHLPPHVHVFSGDDEAQVDIRTGKIIEGRLAGKKLRVVQEWLSSDANRMYAEEEFYRHNPALRLEYRNEHYKKK